MRWKLAGVWLTTALIFLVLFLPVKTHTVTLDMPESMNAAAVDQSAHIFTIVVTAIVILVLLATPVWISWRVVRNHRNSN